MNNTAQVTAVVAAAEKTLNALQNKWHQDNLYFRPIKLNKKTYLKSQHRKGELTDEELAEEFKLHQKAETFKRMFIKDLQAENDKELEEYWFKQGYDGVVVYKHKDWRLVVYQGGGIRLENLKLKEEYQSNEDNQTITEDELLDF